MLTIDSERTEQKIADFIKKSLHETPFTKLAVGLSGGLDSSVACGLAVKGVSYENVVAVMLPYGDFDKKGTEDAQLIIDKYTIQPENIVKIDIKDAVDTILRHSPNADHIRRGNIMARMRMIYMYDLSKVFNALVLGTENKSEYYLGYYTRFGDEASDIEPIRNLYKTQIRELAHFMKMPAEILEKAPSAGLWTDQTDEKEFGFTYNDADRVLSHYFDERLSEGEIIRRGLVPADVVKRVLLWVQANAFKRKLPKVFE